MKKITKNSKSDFASLSSLQEKGQVFPLYEGRALNLMGSNVSVYVEHLVQQSWAESFCIMWLYPVLERAFVQLS